MPPGSFSPSSSFLPSAARGGRTSSRYGFTSVSRFLLADAANPDTQALRAGLLLLSHHVEQATQARRARHAVEAIERQAGALAHHVRQHQLLLTGMDSAWHALHEFRAYQSALHALRGALEGWRAALQQGDGSEPERFGEFERLAWRTLGEALLVLDLYEQQSGGGMPRAALSSTPAPPRRAPLLTRLRRWLAGRGV